MDEWHIGDPVDWGDGFMDAQNWGHGNDEKDSHNDEKHSHRQRDRYSKMAWEYYMEFKEEDALHYINLALDLDKNNSANWNRKAIILEALKRYDESEKCYDKSLKLHQASIVYDNKARMLYSWAVQLREESKKLPIGIGMLEDAKQICSRAIANISESGEENPEKYLKLMDSIDFYIGYEEKYQGNLEILKKYPKKDLFTITGRKFYANVNIAPGMPLWLAAEPDNEFDSDAIAVYADGEKIGYVANKDYTKFELTSKASELRDKVHGTVQAEYLLYLDRYAEIQFSIGRILR